jgi:hypothetical protein
MKTYLSGGIEYAEKFGMNWRNETENWIRGELGHDVFNPSRESRTFFNTHFPYIKRELLKKETEDEIRKVIAELIKFECNEIINNCDYIICYWDLSCQKGAGTQGELTIARYYNKPVYLVTTMDSLDLSSWIIGCTIKIFKSFEDLKIFLKQTYTKLEQ